MKNKTNSLKLGLPKGSLQESTLRLFKKAGYNISISSRSYYPVVDDPDISAMLIRAQEMARYVEDGYLDCGLTGLDWIKEQNADVVEVAELQYGKEGFRPVRWVIAVPMDSKIKTVKDLQGKRIATELMGYTKRFLKSRGVTAQVDFSWGATEVKPPQLADAIVKPGESDAGELNTGFTFMMQVCEALKIVFENQFDEFYYSQETWNAPNAKRKVS